MKFDNLNKDYHELMQQIDNAYIFPITIFLVH